MTAVPSRDAFHLFADDHFLVEHADAGDIPGYVIVRLRTGATSLAELDDETGSRLGAMLARISRAIEAVVKPDRVYCLSFCELERRLHFHLFPRTPALLDLYWSATGSASDPVNGPLLFEWARTRPAATLDRLGGSARVNEVCDALRARLT